MHKVKKYPFSLLYMWGYFILIYFGLEIVLNLFIEPTLKSLILKS